MSVPTDPAANLALLIRCPSVTPTEAGALAALADMLAPLGFSVERPVFSESDTPDVENLYARLGDAGPHLMFAGHTDVVPPGDACGLDASAVRRRDGWRHDVRPRGGRHEGGHRLLRGRRRPVSRTPWPAPRLRLAG